MGISSLNESYILIGADFIYVLLVLLFSTFQPSVTKFEICVSKIKKNESM